MITNKEAIKMLTAKVECMQRETSGTDVDCNLRNCDECELCYAQGTTGEQREALNMAISALQAQEVKVQLPEEGTTSDLISRQAAIDRINKQREHLQPDIYPQDKIGDAAYRICAEFIERLPSAQPEIVRCKDCKFYTAYDYTGKLMCKRIGKGMILPKPEDYCSYAERIADERSD